MSAPTPNPVAPTAATAPAASTRGLYWSLWTALVVTVLVVAGAIGTGLWLWRTESGFAAVARLLPRLTGNVVIVEAPQGSFADGFGAGLLRVQAGSTTVEVQGLRARLSNADLGLRLAGLRFDFDELTAERVRLRIKPSSTPVSGPPQAIGSPVAVSARRLMIGDLAVTTGTDASPSTVALRQIDAGVRIGPEGYAFEDGGLALGPATGPLQLSLAGTLGGRTPFPVDLRGALGASVQQHTVQARWTASGTLFDLLLDAEANAAGAVGSARAQLNIFEPPTLRALQVDLADLDPAAWIEGAPMALLAVRADLRPQTADVFTLRGPVSVTNARPGPVDSRRIPLRAASAQIELTARRLLASEISGELSRGSVRGSYEIGFGDLGRWRAQVRASGVDPAALHSKLRTMLLDGQGSVQRDGDTTNVTGRLVNRRGVPATLNIALALTPRQIQITTSELRLGAGVASVAGTVGLQGEQRTHLAGTVAEFDPSLLLKGVQARVNGNFAVNGVLAPQPTGRVDFVLTDSQAFGRPLAGAGHIALSPEQALDVDLQLAVRSASLSASGGLGAPGKTLQVQLDAPELKELGLPVAGKLSTRASLSGSLRAPAAEVQLAAEQLRYGEHLIEELNGLASYAGGSDGDFAVQLYLASHRFRANPMLSLKTLTVQSTGKPSKHTLDVAGSNDDAQQLAVQFAGGWDSKAERWVGELRTLMAGAPLDLQLRAPAALTTDFRSVRFGPANFTLAGARVEEVKLDSSAGVLASSGRFAGLQLDDLSTGGERLIKIAPRPDREALTLRGEWQLRAGTTVDGQVLIERSGGDVYTSAAAGSAMGITDLRLALQARASSLQGTARLEGKRAGLLEVKLNAELDGGELRLAQQRPLLVTAQADLPSIAWVNAFLPEPLRGAVRFGGSLNGALKVDGTPAEPRADGNLTGKGLRVIGVGQGLRLDNGTLSAKLKGSEILLEELRFEGAPRAAPADRRVRAAGGTDSGSLTVAGSLQLQTLSGVLQVAAQRMPLFQRPDRWVRVDGGANVVFGNKRVQLNGAVAANAGFIDFSRPDLPTLSSDVQVTRTAAQARATRETPTAFTFDLGIDLGPAFYINGLGLDTRIEGAVRLRGDGGAIRATGVVEARDGVFEGFGQRLAIERGRVNFQGPVENPGLDVLALRKGLPVEVGVSITRTVQNPLIRLHSDEAMADFQILSWLVLGRPADESGADRASLATAAVGLLSGTNEGVPAQLAKRLGIDEFSLRTGELSSAGSLLPRTAVAGNVRSTSSNPTVASEFITIGKRLNDQLTISIEQGLGGAESLVQVSYRLSNRVSLIGRAGTENALDIVYSVAFD
ncbi:MAG: translocation/assembly module TamB domain-containing protein [Betaproteobacteria bacterium]